MFKFFKEIIESFKEGVEEGRAELESERQSEYNATHGAVSKVKRQGLPTVENLALALSCPFRSVLTSGFPIRLMEFGRLADDEMRRLRKLLKRDFGIRDAADVSSVLEELASAVDVGYLPFCKVEHLCREKINFISTNVVSWQQFGLLFMEGECINNAIGRRFLKKSIRSLLVEESSPWCIFPWESISKALDSVE